MNKDTLFRMNFILQDSSATTTKNYLRKMIETILFEKAQPLSLDEIREVLYNDYIIEFSNDEIYAAITDRKQRAPTIIKFENTYTLSPMQIEKLSSVESINTLLQKYITRCISELNLDTTEEQLNSLITRYLYFYFNSNTTALLTLIGNTNTTCKEDFPVSEKDLVLINSFLSWDNTEKNKLIYQLVSYCYIYCSLSTKKDTLLSKKIFKNKEFYLDANIIFRLAGINNDERKNTISSFIKKCQEVGIELSFTSVTFDEIIRVISAKVEWIQSITQSSEPLDIDLSSYGNDFYNIYCEWCKKEGNHYSDFASFKKYLRSLIMDILNMFKYVELEKEELISNKNYTSYCDSLINYKPQYKYKTQINASIGTDIQNIIHLIQQRKSSSTHSLFSTNIYFISADQNLINWSCNTLSGVPLVVLPSIWLTILLRFTGRSNDDYTSFVAFMNLRSHSSENALDIFTLIKELGNYTDEKSLKEKIIEEIIYHENEYQVDTSVPPEDVLQKAFDVINAKNQTDQQLIFEREKENLSNKYKDEQKNYQNQEREATIEKLVLHSLARRKKLLTNFQKAFDLCTYVIVVILVLLVFSWFYKIDSFYPFVDKLLPPSLESIELKVTFILGMPSIIITPIYFFINRLFDNQLNNKDKLNTVSEKYRKKHTKILS